MSDYLDHLAAAAYDRHLLDMAESYNVNPDDEIWQIPQITQEERLNNVESHYFEQFMGDDRWDFELPIPY